MYLEIIISDGFRGISRFFGNFVGFRGNTWISRVRDRAKYEKPCKWEWNTVNMLTKDSCK